MFHYLPPKKVKHLKRPKTPYQEYLYTSIGSSNVTFDNALDDIGTTLHGNIQDMRREFRRVSKKIKDMYS